MLLALLLSLYASSIALLSPSAGLGLRRRKIPALTDNRAAWSASWGSTEYVLRSSKCESNLMNFMINGGDQIDYCFSGGNGAINRFMGMFRIQVSYYDVLGSDVTLVPITLLQPPDQALFRVELPQDMSKVRFI